MIDRNDCYPIHIHLVEHAIRKPTDRDASNILEDLSRQQRHTTNPIECPFEAKLQLIAEALALLVVPEDGP